MLKILIIEDDAMLNAGIAHTLKKENYEVICAFEYDEGLSLWQAHRPHLVLLDINLKNKSGLDLCQKMRATSNVPILFITARDTNDDVVKGFQMGCDDYITKPFSIEVLKERIGAVLRRSTSDDSCLLEYPPLKIDLNKMILYKNDVPISLTKTEFKLLEYLAKHAGQVVTRSILLEYLWDIDGLFIDDNTLSVHIKRLRNKIETNVKSPEFILTVFGIGYTFGAR